MKVQIQDPAALSSLPLVNLRVHLGSHGWTDAGTWGERPITVYTKESDGRTWEILVPHRENIGGYASNMADAISVLATVEERSQLDVFYDLASAIGDVIQIHSANGNVRQSLSLSESKALLTDAHSMVASVARAVEQPKAIYRGHMSSEVAEYLDKVRVLPLDYQRYDLTLHSPSPLRLDTQEDLRGAVPNPFSRRVMCKLAGALQCLTEAISGVTSGASFDGFQRSVPYGVSANLCDALANLARRGDGIEIKLVLASVRPANTQEHQFMFSRNSANVLAEAASCFRQYALSLDE